MKGDRRAESCPGLSRIAPPPPQGACFPPPTPPPLAFQVTQASRVGVGGPVRLENR